MCAATRTVPRLEVVPLRKHTHIQGCLPSASIHMLVLNKLCFVLSASSRLSGRRGAAKTATAGAVSFSQACCRMSSSSDDPASAAAAAAAEWPSPAAFNALSHSSRSKIYCDYGDEGSMNWKPHEDPPKVCTMFPLFSHPSL